MAIKNKFGIMQGRLSTPVKKDVIQGFPYDTWTDEFRKAKVLGLDYIEWIFDNPGCNPLFSWSGVRQIKKCMNDTGVNVSTICADYFMDKPIYEEKYREENIEVLEYLLAQAYLLGVKNIVIPTFNMTDLSNISTIQKIIASHRIRHEAHRLVFELDVDFVYAKYFIDELRTAAKGICLTYDIGNAVGRDILLEIAKLSNYIQHIHIKDRTVDGVTKPLGQGDVGRDRWKQIFKLLKNLNYSGNFTLQLARGKDKEEEMLISQYLNQIKEWVDG